MIKTTAAILAALAFSQAVFSAVIDADWQTPGDANLLFDTRTRMQWLDLSATASISHDAVVAGLAPGGMFEGWRLATRDEVLLLWSHAGITNNERVWQASQFAEVEDMVTRLGPTTMFEEGQFNIATHAIGMVEGGPALPISERWAMELTYAPDGLSTRTSASYYTWDVSVASLHYNTYLVQNVTAPADGDLAPWGNPDGVVNAADVLIASQLAMGLRVPAMLQYVHGDMNADGVIDLADLTLIMNAAL